MVSSSTGDGTRILASELGPRDARSSSEVAAAAAEAWEKLGRRFERVIGSAGIRVLLARSVIVTRSQFAWLERAVAREAELPWTALQAALETRPAAEASRAFTELLAAFIHLLARFVGEPLVAQLLHEVWPGVFPHASKETT